MGSICLKTGRKPRADEPESAQTKPQDVALDVNQNSPPPPEKLAESSGSAGSSAAASSLPASSEPAKKLEQQGPSAVLDSQNHNRVASPHASEPSTVASGQPLSGFDSEGSKGGAAKKEAYSSENSQASLLGSDKSPNAVDAKSPPLTKDASDSLRKYAKRNRPNRAKFKTQPANSQACLDSAREASGNLKDEIVSETKTSASGAEQPPSNVPVDKLETDETKLPPLEEKMKKYDIFDDIDGDRLKEFEDMFSKVVKNSNYEAHKKKIKKSKSRFSTAAVVTSDDDTGEAKIT